MTFQSRLTNKWLTPFTDKKVKELAADGVKKILVLSPAFVSDCLETIIEIKEALEDEFIEKKGALWFTLTGIFIVILAAALYIIFVK